MFVKKKKLLEFLLRVGQDREALGRYLKQTTKDHAIERSFRVLLKSLGDRGVPGWLSGQVSLQLRSCLAGRLFIPLPLTPACVPSLAVCQIKSLRDRILMDIYQSKQI